MSPALVALLLGGCTWVTAADVQSRRSEMDDDRDGYEEADDCDDNNADISPGSAETWYDGIDGNCAGDDDFDADADGYVSDAYIGVPTPGVDTSGGLPGGDCNDDDPLAFPGAGDTWYDGVDTDCAGDDDFDADSDGFVKINADGLPTENVPGSGALPGDDCDDGHADVYPGAPDTWYDGTDSDCGGEDDYDADDDGYVPDDYVGLETRLVNGSGGLPGDDCDDNDSAANPGETETWYDGPDNDCDATTVDNDQDADGYFIGVPDDPDPDCDDTDASVNPGALEILGDSTDSDCDGDNDSFPTYGLSTWYSAADTVTWTNPHDLVFDSNSSTIFLSLAADAIILTKGTSSKDYSDRPIALSFDSTDPTAGITDDTPTTSAIGYPLSPSYDFMATDDYLLSATGRKTNDYRVLYLAAYDLNAAEATFEQSRLANPSSGSKWASFESISMALDSSERVYAFGCEADTQAGQYLSAALSDLADSTSSDSIDADWTDWSASVCELHAYASPDVTVLSTDGTDLTTTVIDSTASVVSTTTDDSFAPLDIEVLREPSDTWTVLADQVNDALVIIEPDGNETVYDTGGAPTQVQAVWDAVSDQLVMGWVDDAGGAHMAWGYPPTFESYDLDPGFSATETAVTMDATGEVVLVAILGGNNVVLGMAHL